ncbi:hypothetical protein GY637_25310, partial [Escherichia coli]|nr:hypothetical protein [Escherichia coli]
MRWCRCEMGDGRLRVLGRLIGSLLVAVILYFAAAALGAGLAVNSGR